ncbi:MAG: glycoside hydrolase family 31 protein, partial [Cyclobacteriaceae bacterium]|nr:glycoside hydrolase family 31 protein [Cyclobacteriaceae bacterium]
MDIKRSYTGIGTSEDEGFMTFLVYSDHATQSFEVNREYEKSTTLKYEKENQVLKISLSGKKCPHILKIAMDHKPEKIELDGKELVEGSDFEYESNLNKLNIRTTLYENGIYQIHL